MVLGASAAHCGPGGTDMAVEMCCDSPTGHYWLVVAITTGHLNATATAAATTVAIPGARAAVHIAVPVLLLAVP